MGPAEARDLNGLNELPHPAGRQSEESPIGVAGVHGAVRYCRCTVMVHYGTAWYWVTTTGKLPPPAEHMLVCGFVFEQHKFG